MSAADPQQTPTCGSSEPQPPSSNLYESPEEALKKLAGEFEYWTGKFTDTTLQMCYALIGANWVIFGSLAGVLKHPWSLASLILVMLALASNVIGAWLLSESLRGRIRYAESDNQRWQQEFRNVAPFDDFWPFNRMIQISGQYMRWIKGGLTLASGICLIAGALWK